MSENDSSESDWDTEMDPEEEKEYRRQVEESDIDWCFSKFGVSMLIALDMLCFRYTYDVELFGRLGLHCYNLLHKGTNLKLLCIPKYNTLDIALTCGYYLTLEAMDTHNNSPCTFQTYVREVGQTSEHGYLVVQTNIARLKVPTGPHNTSIGRGWIWGWEEEAIDVYYKGKLPKWLTNDMLAAAKDEYYVVQESEFLENEWLHLYAEIALYSNWKWHATRKSCEESPHLKLKADNAIFYMSFKGSGDHPSGKHYEYQAIVRKTMDGKPGHIRLEVDSWEGIPSDLIGEDKPP
ncbi:hypothetical protein ARALYDRAFT_491864 [Arabidopsis lyrata subsp. lyrata]|uniref:Uncharacterized protein n=1 Tax=Arabidopsis lyrata subsp. lyrata TaxID=81972 RepID=D7MD66_ARALL|nr:hypothetical protein ARALYDRAFT_491864 [Arabidopsis lyrata subsp. lyrata]